MNPDSLMMRIHVEFGPSPVLGFWELGKQMMILGCVQSIPILTLIPGRKFPGIYLPSMVSCRVVRWGDLPNIWKPEEKSSILPMGYIHACMLGRVRLCDPMDCSSPGSSAHGILQARILEWVAISFSRGSSQSRDQTHVFCGSCIGRSIPHHWAFLQNNTWTEVRNIGSPTEVLQAGRSINILPPRFPTQAWGPHG